MTAVDTQRHKEIVAQFPTQLAGNEKTALLVQFGAVFTDHAAHLLFPFAPLYYTFAPYVDSILPSK